MLGTETWAPARKATLTLTYQTNIYDTLWEFIPNKKGICVFRERERHVKKKKKEVQLQILAEAAVILYSGECGSWSNAIIKV